jgi:hypothetical protein
LEARVRKGKSAAENGEMSSGWIAELDFVCYGLLLGEEQRCEQRSANADTGRIHPDPNDHLQTCGSAL